MVLHGFMEKRSPKSPYAWQRRWLSLRKSFGGGFPAMYISWHKDYASPPKCRMPLNEVVSVQLSDTTPVTVAGDGKTYLVNDENLSKVRRRSCEFSLLTKARRFNFRTASLFEAVIEAAFLVANADGVFDEAEQTTFETVVSEACKNSVQQADLSALVADLREQLDEDGAAHRISMVAQVVSEGEHKLEVLRIAALMAHISGGVDDSERKLMDDLAQQFGLDQQAVDTALQQAQLALGR